MVEAADDICYQIIDIEDSHRLGILSTQLTSDLLLSFFDPQIDRFQLDSIHRLIKTVDDENEQITILRSRVINKLIDDVTRVFWEKYPSIMNCSYFSNLVDDTGGCTRQAMNDVKKIAQSKIYNARSVIEIQIAGHKILGELLDEFIRAALNNNSLYSEQLMMLCPSQLVCKTDNTFDKIMSMVDFIAGMTDIYALELYRKIKGISFSVIH
jgi:dGTPase